MNELLKNQNTTEVKDERDGHTSASNAAADKRCAGRHHAQKGMPDIQTEDATFGTMVHDALAKNDPSKLNGIQLSIYESHQEINEKLLKQVFGAESGKAIVMRERRLWCEVLAKPGDKALNPPRYRHSGKLDYLARIGSRALIVEYKSLPGDVDESPTNEQLRDQVVLAAGNLALKEIVTAINQPLITHSPELCLYNEDSIRTAEQEMFVRVRNSNNPKSKRTANAVSCKFCKARWTCSQYEEWAASQLPETTPVIGVPIASWTPEQRAYYCTMRGVAKRWLEDCDTFIKDGLKLDAGFVPGFGLKPGAVQRKINDAQELFTRFVALGKDWAEKDNGEMHADHILLPLFMGCVDIKKGEVETLVRKLTGLKGKGLLGQMEKLLEGITDENQNDSSLTKVS